MNYIMSALGSEMTITVFSPGDTKRDVFMKSPRVIDGMGDAMTIKTCSDTGKDLYKMMAEIIDVEFEDADGKTVRESFCGIDSYRVQDAIEETMRRAR